MVGPSKQQSGFTLIELITVIVILGILVTSVSQFLRYGVRSYTDSVDREEIISNARFVIERLNREVRNALPNSIRVTSDTNMQCLEFIPINSSAIYIDIPVAPEAANNTVEVMMLQAQPPASVNSISVYALNSADIYNRSNGVIEPFDNVAFEADGNTPSTITLSDDTLFNAESPTNRLYFIEAPVAYCLTGSLLYRYNGYNYSADFTPVYDGTNRHLMAEYLANNPSLNNELPFRTVPATLQRNGLALTRFKFSRNLEEIVFNNEIQVPNVP